MIVKFASVNAPSLKISTGDPEIGRLVFVNGVLNLDDENPKDKKKIDIMREALKNNPALSSQVREIDVAAAERIAKAFQEKMIARTKGIAGALTASSIRAAASDVLKAQQSDELIHQGGDPEAVKTATETIAEANKLENVLKSGKK